MSIAASHMAPMPSNQSHDPSTEAGVPLAPRPDGQSLPHSCLDLGKASTVSFTAPVPSGPYFQGTGVNHEFVPPVTDGHPLSSTAGEDDEDEVPSTQTAVSPFVHLIGQVRDYLQLPSPEVTSSAQPTGVERVQGSGLPCQPPLTLSRSLMAQAVREEV